jgi:peptidoglycan/LPS O-acetylase OafA/YrhL
VVRSQPTTVSILTCGKSILPRRMPELDTLRGIAVLLVLFFHGFNLTPIHAAHPSAVTRLFLLFTAGGWSGVRLFFVLSGFLITGILLDSRDSSRYYAEFYYRRALRILPAYYLILIVLPVATHLGITDRRVGWPFLALSSIYLSNMTPFFGVISQYTVLWSLAVEEQFYLLWPGVVRLFSQRGLMIVCVVLLIGCPSLRAYYYLHGNEAGAGYTWLVADSLAGGAALAILVRGSLRSPKELGLVAIGVGIAAVAIFLAGLPYGIYLSRTMAGNVVRQTFLNLLFTAVVAAALSVGSTRYGYLCRIGWLKFFGDISYGLYLVHMLVFDVVDHLGRRLAPWAYSTTQEFPTMVARFLVGSGLSIAIAYLSRWYFEERFLRLRDKAKPAPPAAIPATEEQPAAS